MGSHQRVMTGNGTPRVLHILAELRPSGAEVMLRIAAPWWFAADRPHAILATAEEEGPFAGRLREAGYQVHHIRFSKTLRFFIEVYVLIRLGRYDAVHIHTERVNLVYAIVARLAGAGEVIHTIHSTFTFTGGLRLVRGFMRAGLRWLGVSEVSVGASVLENEIRRFFNPTIVISNWYDDKLFRQPTHEERLAARAAQGINDDRPVIVTLGNCEPVKNHGAVIRAQQILVRKRRDWFYLHAGGEDAERTERTLAADLGVARRCAFLGYARDPISVLWAADVFVMSSFREGFSIAAIEAAACGLPLVLTDVPGLRDLKATIPDGFWVQPEPAAIAGAIEAAYLRFPSGSAGNASSVRGAFGIETGAKAYYDLYAGVHSAAIAARSHFGRVAMVGKGMGV
jgi:glycosyltransferase involved in cell wall biosynthesis